MPALSDRIRVSKDGQYVLATGKHTGTIIYLTCQSVLRIRDILVRIRIRGDPYLWRTPDPDPDTAPDPAIFASDLQGHDKMSTKNYFFS